MKYNNAKLSSPFVGFHSNRYNPWNDVGLAVTGPSGSPTGTMNPCLFNDIFNGTNWFIHCFSNQPKRDCLSNSIFNDLFHVNGNIMQRKPWNICYPIVFHPKMLPSNVLSLTYPPIIKSLAIFFSFCLSFILCILKYISETEDDFNSRLENEPQSRIASVHLMTMMSTKYRPIRAVLTTCRLDIFWRSKPGIF